MEWRDVEGYPGYQVSDLGFVKSKKTGRPLKSAYNCAYHRVSLSYAPWKFRTVSVHRLVAKAFLQNPHNLPIVDHIDRDRNNNALSNLRWVDLTQSRANQGPRTTRTQFITEVFKLAKLGFTEKEIQSRLRDTSSFLRQHETSGRKFRKDRGLPFRHNYDYSSTPLKEPTFPAA